MDRISNKPHPQEAVRDPEEQTPTGFTGLSYPTEGRGIQFGFPTSEYLDRLARTRAAMVEREIDILVVSDPSNMAWLTGYDGWSFYVHQAVVVTLDDEQPFWWGRYMDRNGARRTVYMDEDRIIGYSDELVQSSYHHPMEDLSRVLAALPGSSIGVEMDNYYFSAAAWETLRVGLPNAEFKDATALVNWQRAIKSDQELVYMRRAGRIVEAMHARIAEVIEPGMRKNELVAEILSTSVRGADGFGGDYPAIVPMLPTGVDASAPHLTWDDRPLERDSVTFIEIAGCYRRYHAPLCRTVHLGEPPPEVRHAEKALLAGLEAGIEAARAGGRTADVADALDRELKAVGIERTGRCGYSIGLSYPPDWGERTMSIRASDGTVLEPGMTFHFMPGLWMDDWGVEITESILIREEGPAVPLCSYPREILVRG